MSWNCYRVVFRLCSPLHVGWRKLGNLQQTRPYVTGKIMWGALTARLTRDLPESGGDYRQMGDRVNDELAFSYFYPAVREQIDVLWPWGKDSDEFNWRYINSYASTALDYTRNAAEEGSLHETEFISPRTRDGKSVYLIGYIFARNDSDLPWRNVLSKLQLGGERGYGWGRVKPAREPEPLAGRSLFDGMYTVDPNGWPLVLIAGKTARLSAHGLAAEFKGRKPIQGVQGEVEPLVGRETCSAGRFGIEASEARICYAPGSAVTAGARMQIGPDGIWEEA